MAIAALVTPWFVTRKRKSSEATSVRNVFVTVWGNPVPR
jgi:hypothetical protein